MKTFTLEKTKDPDLKKVVDRSGDWSHYLHVPSKRFLRAVNAILSSGFAKDRRFMDYLLRSSKEEAEKRLKVAGERGDHIHQAIAQLLKSPGRWKRSQICVFDQDADLPVLLTDSEWTAVLAFADFWNRHAPKVIMNELACYSLEHGYAGTLDAVWILRKKCDNKYCGCGRFINKIGIPDFKTGGGIYPEYAAQEAAYANAESIGKILKAKRAWPLEYTMTLRIGTKHKCGWESDIHGIGDTHEAFRRFKAAILISDATYEPFTMADIEDIPETVNLVRKYKAPAKKRKTARKPASKPVTDAPPAPPAPQGTSQEPAAQTVAN